MTYPGDYFFEKIGVERAAPWNKARFLNIMQTQFEQFQAKPESTNTAFDALYFCWEYFSYSAKEPIDTKSAMGGWVPVPAWALEALYIAWNRYKDSDHKTSFEACAGLKKEGRGNRRDDHMEKTLLKDKALAFDVAAFCAANKQGESKTVEEAFAFFAGQYRVSEASVRAAYAKHGKEAREKVAQCLVRT